MASGSPSSRRHNSATAAEFLAVRRKPGRTAAARCTNSAAEAHSISRRGKQPAALGQWQWRDRELLLAVNAKRVTAGHEHGEPGARVEHLSYDRGGGGGDLLEIVHEQKCRSARIQVLAQNAHERTFAARGHTKRARHRRRDKIRLGDRRQVDERHAALEARREIGGDLDGESRLPGAARPCERQQPNSGVQQPFLHVGDLGSPSNQRRALWRKIVIAWLTPGGQRAEFDRLRSGNRQLRQLRRDVAGARARRFVRLEHPEKESLERWHVRYAWSRGRRRMRRDHTGGVR